MTTLTTAIRCAARLALALGCAAAAAATRVDLNLDWTFIVDPADSGEKSGWVSTAPAQAEPVRLPHSWNRPGAHHSLIIHLPRQPQAPCEVVQVTVAAAIAIALRVVDPFG